MQAKRAAIPRAEPPFRQRETKFWVPTPRCEPRGAGIPTEVERREFEVHRWWTLAQIEAYKERFTARAPIDAGV